MSTQDVAVAAGSAGVCAVCGAALEPGSAFCGSCGARVTAAPGAGVTAAPAPHARPTADQPLGGDGPATARVDPLAPTRPGAPARVDPLASSRVPAPAPGWSLGADVDDAVAPVWRRLVALLVDQALAVLVGGAGLLAVLPALRSDGSVGALLVPGLLLLLLAAGQWFAEAFGGRTVGGALLGTRTVSARTGRAPGLWAVLVRSVVQALGVLLGGVGVYVVAGSGAWDEGPEQRGWHDKVAGTLVLRARAPRREEPAPAPAAPEPAAAPAAHRTGPTSGPPRPAPSTPVSPREATPTSGPRRPAEPAPAPTSGPARTAEPTLDPTSGPPRAAEPALAPTSEPASPSDPLDPHGPQVPARADQRGSSAGTHAALASTTRDPGAPRHAVPSAAPAERDDVAASGPAAAPPTAVPAAAPPTAVAAPEPASTTPDAGVPRDAAPSTASAGETTPGHPTGGAPQATAAGAAVPAHLAPVTAPGTADAEPVVQPTLSSGADVGLPDTTVPTADLGDLEHTRVGRWAGSLDAASSALALVLDTGERYEVTGAGLIGRRPVPGTDQWAHLVTIDDPAQSVSSTHLAFWPVDGGLDVLDRGSTNGTVLLDAAGKPWSLPPGQPARVGAGWTLVLGSRRVTVTRS